MGHLSKIDKAITIIKYILSDKQDRIDAIGRKMQPTEKEKIFVGQEVDLIRNVNLLIDASQKAFNAHLGKMAPTAIDLEEAVIGALMLERMALPSVVGYLEVEHFYKETHQQIYQA